MARRNVLRGVVVSILGMLMVGMMVLGSDRAFGQARQAFSGLTGI